MKVGALSLLMIALARGAIGELPPSEASYKILMLLPISSKSHRNVFMPIAEALADRGHKIEMLTNQPKSSSHPNIHELEHGVPGFKEEDINTFDSRKDPAGVFSMFDSLPVMARKLYQVPEVINLYNRRKEFDVIFVDFSFNEMAYPFLHEMPFIGINTGGLDSRQSTIAGNILIPSYVPNMMFEFPAPMSAWHRFLNVFYHIALPVYWRSWAIVPRIQKEISAQFPDLPPLLEIEKNHSLALINTHFSLTMTVPLLPSQVEVGAIHCRPAQPLPEDLESWISGAGAEGVIYFSLGSVTRGNSMPVEYRNVFVETFRRLPHRIIWKYEGELEGVSDNVLIKKWLPQQDILAHDKVKAFITHGGLLSLQEAIYHPTPLLAIPIYGDQPKNGLFVQNNGLGDSLVWEEINTDMVIDALTEITSNTKYKDNVDRMSKALRDQLTTPKERAVFWTEYIIRHRGAPQLRCPAAQLSWVEFLMLDVLSLLLVALAIFIYILRRVLRAIWVMIFGGGGKKKME